MARRRQAGRALQASNRRLEQALAQVSAREETIRQYIEHLRHLNDLARSVSRTLDLDSVCHQVVQQIPQLMAAAICVVAQYDSAADQFRYLAVWRLGALAGPMSREALALDNSIFGVALTTPAPIVTDDTRRSLLAPLPDYAGAGILSSVTVPITVGDVAWGVLVVGFDEPYGATPDRVEFLTSSASHLAVAIKNAELYTRLQHAHESLKATQQQIVQQERLSALGQMASGIVHDFNNALSPIVGFSELLLVSPDALDDKDLVREHIALIHASALDAANVVNRLREFYRPREAAELLAPVQLNAVVTQAIAFARPKWSDQAQASGKTISIETVLPPVPPVPGNDAHLREMLANLIFNAVDAIPKRGTLTIRTRAQGDRVVLQVSDTGVGMTEDVRRRCLEPFFTTKGEEGTGLGLAMAYGVVQRHQGTIDVESAPGAGTTFTISLPALTEAQAPAPVAATTTRHATRVLVVDDAAAIRELLTIYLRAEGHQVEAASNGREALQRFDAGQFDVVITDRAMPAMSGDQLAAAIKQRSPTTPVIMLSGFGDLMATTGERPANVDAVMGKPVTAARLRGVLAKVLGGSG